MPKMTVSVPDDLLKRLRKDHPEINWAAVVRMGILKRLEELEKFEVLKTSGVLESQKFEDFLRKLKVKGVM